MVRRYRPTETPTTPIITDPVILRQMREQNADADAEWARLHPTVLCSCNSHIEARHLARHQRSKTHTTQLDWYRTQLLISLAESNRRADQATA